MEKIKVVCENTESHIEVAMGTSLSELCEQLGIKGKYPILAAYVNNRIKELNYLIYTPVTIRFVDITHFVGYRVYQRTASFVAQKAVRELYPGRNFHIRHSLADGFYCEIEGESELTQADCDRIAAGETKPCSEIGKSRTYEQKIAKGGTAMALYRKAYKTHFARIRSGTMTREQFEAWKDEATTMRQKVESGILDMDEYAIWLKK